MRAPRPPSRRRDLVIAAVVAWLTISGSAFFALRRPPERALDWLAYGLLATSAGVLVVRRRAPLAVLAVTALCTVAFGVLGYTAGGPFVLPLMVALFTAVSAGHRVPAVVVAVTFLGGFVLAALAGGGAREALPFVPGWLVAVLVAGEVARGRRDYHAEAGRRAAAAERTREEEMRRRASEERLRIAREVHDVLSHSISMINVQAGVAVHLLDSRPEQARTALVAIKQASKEALRDLRATLGVLRDVDGDDRAPARGLARMEELVAGAQAAGVHLEVGTHGDPVPLPAGVDLAAYRIVQQSVSNIVRHAGASTGTVDLRYGDGDLTIIVENAPGARDGEEHADGAGGQGAGESGAGQQEAGESGAGEGIPGMRERAEALGGELVAGPLPAGGFRVRARLPLGGPADPERGQEADGRRGAGGRGPGGAGERPGGWGPDGAGGHAGGWARGGAGEWRRGGGWGPAAGAGRCPEDDA